MVLLRTKLSYQFCTLSKIYASSKYLKSPLLNHSVRTHCISNCYNFSFCSPIFGTSFSLSRQFVSRTEADNTDSIEEKGKEKRRRLDVFFREAVELSEKRILGESDSESDPQTKKLKGNLRKLEKVVSKLQENRKVGSVVLKESRKDNGVQEHEKIPKSLSSLFKNKATAHSGKSGEKKTPRMDDSMVYKELSPDMEMFARRLYKEGYLNFANLFPRNKFDVACFENSYGHSFIQFAADKFGKDNQGISKWLSGSDLKKVALFGCPSLSTKNVFYAKQLRAFFQIQEEQVCRKCPLKQSCRFVNQGAWKGNTNSLDLAVVMRVIILYALDSVPPQLVVPVEIKASVSNLLKEILNLSQPVLRGFEADS